MKVLFLDIDGVLNRDGTKERIETVLGPFTSVDTELLNKFLNWIKDKDVDIVLSSSWRLDGRYHGAFREHLNSIGIKWIDVTPKLGHRGEEIHQWYKANSHRGITHFAILDDMSDMHPVGKALVQTSSHRGLEDKHLKKLNQLLEV